MTKELLETLVKELEKAVAPSTIDNLTDRQKAVSLSYMFPQYDSEHILEKLKRV